MTFDEQVETVRESGLIHSTWYCETYPDVAMLGLHPAVHYMRYGAAMGRNPGKTFHTRNYLRAYPDVARTGMNPLLHYVLHGVKENRRKSPDPLMLAYREVDRVRGKLLGLDFTDPALADMRSLADTSDIPAARAMALRELALWEMREGRYEQALGFLTRAHRLAPDSDFRAKLLTVELLCHHRLGANAGRALFDAADPDDITPDVMLARANLEDAPEARLDWINRVLADYDIPALSLLDDGPTPYDRLTPPAPLPAVTDGPKITVLIASYDAADTLPTTLRSLSEQSWQNWEALVLDDAGPDNTAEVVADFTARDPRVKFIAMPVNGGAYRARNHGLDIATGDYVTLHDADDWSHPAKLETQVRYLMANGDKIACTSQQARAMSDLRFLRWTGRGNFIIHNTSSLMFRRAPVREALGYWDTVRFAADSELIRRMQKTFGKDCVKDMQTGPLSFQRDSDTSVVADDVMGMNGFYFGVRKEYFDAQRAHHKQAETLKYTNDIANRPFPVPPMMRPERKELLAEAQHFDVIFAGDFRLASQTMWSVIDRVGALRQEGKTIGIVELYDYALPTNGIKRIHDALRAEITGTDTRVVVFGETVTCTELHHVSGQWDTRFVPKITETDPG